MKSLKPFDNKYLEGCLALGNKVLTKVEDANARLAFKKSLTDEWQMWSNYVSLKYLVAVGDLDEIIGTICLFELKKDVEEALWIGWFMVDPEHRGEGIGTMLLDLAMEEAYTAGKKYIRLWTDTGVQTNQMYEKRGFKIVEQKLYLIKREKVLI